MLAAQSQSVSKKQETVTQWEYFISGILRGYGLMELAKNGFYYRPEDKSPSGWRQKLT